MSVANALSAANAFPSGDATEASMHRREGERGPCAFAQGSGADSPKMQPLAADSVARDGARACDRYQGAGCANIPTA